MRQHFLAIPILLLSLNVAISAQSRTPDEALEGLGEIGVIVKYGNADGLPEVRRPTVLQMLQERAMDMLRHREVPILQSTEEADMAGRPRLVFTITLNKWTEQAPAIEVETRLSERVRLRRDAGKTMELATWVNAAYGFPKVTEKMLFDVFDHQVKQFIKDYLAMNPKATKVKSRTAIRAAQLKDNANSLRGLRGVDVFVWSRSSRSVDAPVEALLQTLQGEAEKKLKKAGIPLQKNLQGGLPGRPLLYLAIKLSGANSHAPAIAIETKFWPYVLPVRDTGKQSHAVTWESLASDGGPITDNAILQVMNSQLDEFIKAYKTAKLDPSSISR